MLQLAGGHFRQSPPFIHAPRVEGMSKYEFGRPQGQADQGSDIESHLEA